MLSSPISTVFPPVARANDVAVSVRNLSKAYTIAHDAPKHTTMAEALVQRLKHPLRRQGRRETFWAIQDVSFEIKKGEVVGIIGRNGAGKSTLLKILSRITVPTSGEADLYGRVGSLLEVGTGFHAELTGRENIYLNGQILGMRRREIARQFDEIVDFSGVEQFLDTPVKRYSSGMYVRLAFAVAAYLQSEILVVDEVLAVGDAEFQKKCLGKMKDVATGGRTVLFVSHNMQAVSVLCNRGVLLSAGRVAYDGNVEQAVDLYLQSYAASNGATSDLDRRPGTGEYRFVSAEPTSPVFAPDAVKRIRYKIARRGDLMGRMYLSAYITDHRGAEVCQCDSRLVGVLVNDAPALSGVLEISHPWLKPGSYRVDLFLCITNGVIDHFAGACTIDVSPVLPYAFSASEDANQFGLVFGDFRWCPEEVTELAETPPEQQASLIPIQDPSAFASEVP
jgi:lipopolysaccharide transport system ATP-binding protein